MHRGCVFSVLLSAMILPPAEVQAQTTTQSPAQTPTAPQSAGGTSSGQAHTIAVTFDYDFDKTPACSAKVTQKCVKEFVIYDISGGPNHPFKIGTVALPDNPVGNKQGISGKSDSRVFESGQHLIAVTAQEPAAASSSQSGKQPGSGQQSKPLESPAAACTTWVTIP
jgi:hypothetical protein